MYQMHLNILTLWIIYLSLPIKINSFEIMWKLSHHRQRIFAGTEMLLVLICSKMWTQIDSILTWHWNSPALKPEFVFQNIWVIGYLIFFVLLILGHTNNLSCSFFIINTVWHFYLGLSPRESQGLHPTPVSD